MGAATRRIGYTGAVRRVGGTGLRAVLVAVASLALPATASAERAYNVLPAGQYGGIPTTPNSTDQLSLYDALTPLGGNVGASDLTRYFKPENLQPVGATTVDATPRAGVTIRRDSYGVPHIYGRTRADVWYGVGWITAADRGLLLQQGRGAARAAVAEVPGLDAFSLVTGLRSFTPSRQAERLVSSEQRALVRTHGEKGRQILRDMDEYGAGINAWYASRPGPPPARWTRNDTIAVFAFIGSIFGNGGGAEAQNAEFLSSLRRRLGRRRAARAFLDLMSADDPEHATTIRRRYRNGRESARPTKGSPLVDAGKLKLTPDPSKRTEASNFLVVGDSRTAGANTQAVMGPQLGYFYPQIVLEAGLHGPGLEAQGAIGPGIGPYVLIGRTREYSWSLTTAQNDNRDVFLERLCGTRRYRYKGRCRRMKRFDAGELGAGGGQPAKRLIFYTTVHGPVFGTARVGGKRYAVVRARSTYKRDIASIAALRDMTLDRGRTVDGFFRSVNQFEFTFNWAYASHGNVAYFSSGRIPRAERGVNELLPRLGTGRYDWKGFLSRRQHPQAVNPRGGLLLNWNNKPAPGWLPGDDVHSYGSVHRVELFKGFARQVTLENTASVMNRAATRDLRATEVWPVIRAVLGSSRAPDARTAQAVAILDRWSAGGSSRLDRDLDGRVDDAGAAVMDAAFEPMANAVLRPVLGSRLLSRLATLHERDRAPYKDDVNGSSFGSGWYGYVDKDLRRLLGRRVRGRFGLRYCGRGSLSRCRASLWSALGQATTRLAASQGANPEAWRSDATLERIGFRPDLIPNTARWTNRPTFQQVIEFDRR